MIEVLKESSGNLLVAKATGKLTETDYEEIFIPKITALIEKYDKVNVLLQLDKDFCGWEMGAMWDDAKFGLKYRNNFEKVAVVGASTWMEWAINLSSYFVSGEVESFDDDEFEKALAWIKNEVNLFNFVLDKENRILHVRPEGQLKKENFDSLAKAVEPFIQKNGKLTGLIVETEDFPGWQSFAAMIRHFKFIRNHHNKIKKIALVTDSILGDVAEKITSHFVDAEIREFDMDELEEAKRWVLK